MKNSQHKNLIQLFHKAVDQGLQAQPIQNYPWPNPSGQPKPPSTNGINMKNSQHKNLTQLFHKAVDQGL